MAEQPRIGIWRAVSTEDQAEKESLEYQDRLNREHAARWNGVIVAEMEVPGISRSIVLWEDACRTIPAYAQLDDLIKRKAIDILICMDVTRLGRDRALIVTAAALCERAGIRIYETSSPPTSIEGPHSTSDSRLLMMLKGHISEEEVRKFAERANFGRQAQVRKGKHPNHQPYGYKRDYKNGEAITVLDEERAPIVQIFYDLWLEHGRSLLSIAKEFNARGYLRPRSENEWTPGAVATFLRNRWAYAGYTTWGLYSRQPEKSFRAKAEWPALITEDMVYRTEEEMKKRARAPRAVGNPRLFSLLCRCAVCGGMVTCKNIAGRHSRDTTYVCTNRCPGSVTHEPIILDAMREAILILQHDAMLDRMVGQRPTDNNNLVQQIEITRTLLEDAQKERAKLTRAFMRDTIDAGEYESLMAELKERQAKLMRTVTDLETQLAKIPTPEKRRNQLEQIRDDGLAMLYHEDIKTANAWLRQHFIIFLKGGKVEEVHLY